MRKLGVSKTYREACGQFLCDGIKLLEEAVKCDADVKAVLTSAPIPFPLSIDTQVYFAERSIIDSISPLKNAQEILFTCRIPGIPEITGNTRIMGVRILLDGIQDPGNVGTIIRTADALGVSSVIMTGECADPYNPKTVRATMGALFRQSISRLSISELTQLSSRTRFIAAVPDADNPDVSQVDFNDSVIVIGSEGRGISPEVLSLCCEKTFIPISPECDSLNASVAAAIMMWEARRKRDALMRGE